MHFRRGGALLAHSCNKSPVERNTAETFRIARKGIAYLVTSGQSLSWEEKRPARWVSRSSNCPDVAAFAAGGIHHSLRPAAPNWLGLQGSTWAPLPLAPAAEALACHWRRLLLPPAPAGPLACKYCSPRIPHLALCCFHLAVVAADVPSNHAHCYLVPQGLAARSVGAASAQGAAQLDPKLHYHRTH